MSQKSQFKEMYNDEEFNLEAMPPNLLDQLHNQRLLGNICSFGDTSLFYKQQQQAHLENKSNHYEYIRQKGRRATWEEIKLVRRKLQRFDAKPVEYKKVFDMIIKSYIQLRNSLEYLEEFWTHLMEFIYGEIQTGKLQFDSVWKNCFNDKILGNTYIRYFLQDVTEQYQRMAKTKPAKASNKLILDEITQNLVKIRTDLKQEHIIEDLINLQQLMDQHQKAATNDAINVSDQNI